MSVPNILTIAGTDPSGGAGISADLKTFSALGGFGCYVVTAVVAQNTQGVAGIAPMTPEFVRLQLDNLLEDVRIDAVKIGMLGSAAVIEQVADVLAHHPGLRGVPRVLDPVMVASSGDRLIDEDAIDALRTALVPNVDIMTPNLPEAGVLLDAPTPSHADEATARALTALGPAVLLKGGHAEGETSVDILLTDPEAEPIRLEAKRIQTRNTHGTGCTLSAAMATLRATTGSWEAAVPKAKDYMTRALATSDQLNVGTGAGHGPVHHFHAWW